MPDRDTRKVATAGAPLPTIPPELAEALARAPSVNLNPQPLLPRQPSNMRFRKLPSVVPPPSSNQSSTTSLIGEMPTHPSESLTSLASPPPSAYGFMVNSSNPSIVNDNGNGIATPPLTGNPMTRKSDKNLFSLLRKSNTLTSDPRLVSPTNSDASPTFRNTGLSREPTMSSIRSRKSILPSLLSQTGSVHSAETASLSENNLGGHTMVRQTSSSSDHALEHQVTLRDVTLSCAHKGWLNKLTVTHSAIFARKSWRRRFFVLCGSALYRFKSGTPDSLSSETLGLTPESIVCVSDAFPGRRWVLEVTSLNIGTWFIQAEGKEDMKQWMSALKAAVGRIQYSSTRNLSHTVAGDTAVGSGGSRGAYFQPSPVSSSSGDRSGAELSGSENEEIADELQQNPLTPESVRGLLNDNIGSLSIMLYPGTNRRASQSSDSTAIMSPRLSWASRANSRLSGASHSNYSPVLPDLHQGAVSGPDGGSSQPRSYFDSMLYKHPLPTPAYTTTPTLPTPSSTGVPDFSPGLANGGYPNGVDTMTSSRTGGLSLNDRRPAPTTNPSSTALPIVREDLAD
ncbi:hypothetical protein BJ085DRAFT_37970 [Dimargaris cristalligena]|uniref:PH domain-containing protein n=1 Tax=Dimargaris cristalligena TaxID=215637 RepID=A0A4P9ZKG7_9FUNG|nr:hypothetical protein BJ085DRAFT_37970 [Dimargaris cristalligena]|eukprot:RKP33585.1 hypothetical protein BJ085DRAFT_37970 [Dimargaris cristalligena]